MLWLICLTKWITYLRLIRIQPIKLIVSSKKKPKYHQSLVTLFAVACVTTDRVVTLIQMILSIRLACSRAVLTLVTGLTRLSELLTLTLSMTPCMTWRMSLVSIQRCLAWAKSSRWLLERRVVAVKLQPITFPSLTKSTWPKPKVMDPLDMSGSTVWIGTFSKRQTANC